MILQYHEFDSEKNPDYFSHGCTSKSYETSKHPVMSFETMFILELSQLRFPN